MAELMRYNFEMSTQPSIQKNRLVQISVSSYGSFAPEVEPGADVADDLGVRISFSHEGDLSVEVCQLLFAGDAAVADDLGRS